MFVFDLPVVAFARSNCNVKKNVACIAETDPMAVGRNPPLHDLKDPQAKGKEGKDAKGEIIALSILDVESRIGGSWSQFVWSVIMTQWFVSLVTHSGAESGAGSGAGSGASEAVKMDTGIV